MRFRFGFLFWKSLFINKYLLPQLAACAALATASAAAQTAPSYAIDTIAGPGDLMSGAASQVKLNTPRSVAVDSASNVYIADRLNDRILKVDAAGNTSTFAGTETRGYSGDGGPATAAQLFSPEGVAVDDMGNVYIADTNNNRIRKVDAAGIISTLAGTGEDGYSGDGGPAAEAQLSLPFSVAADGAGNIYIAGNDRIRKVDAAGNISTFAGMGIRGYIGDGGPAAAARFNAPHGIAADAAGNVYIADTGNNRIRKVDAAGVITTVAGTGVSGYSGDGGPAVSANLHYPAGVAVDSADNIYIADTENHRIRKVDADGSISTVAGSAGFGLSGDGGPATAAEFVFPADVAVDNAGNLYIADTENHRIRRVDVRGYIATFAGTETHGFSGDGGPATLARLDSPQSVAVDSAGNVYIADTYNHCIRRLRPKPRISAGGIVLATGTPAVSRISPNALISVFGQDFASQGTPTLSPRLDAPDKVAADLAETCLEIGGKRAPLFLVAPNQINAQTPHDLMPGQTQAAVVRDCGAGSGLRGEAVTVATEAVSPAFFNALSNPDGRNPVVALHGGGPDLVGAPGLLPGAEFTPAVPGELVTLFGTGFGAVEPPLESGQIPGAVATLANAVAFTVGGIAVPPEDVLYAGASPCCAGLYQFTLRVPPDVPNGDAAVMATVSGISTPQGPFITVRGEGTDALLGIRRF